RRRRRAAGRRAAAPLAPPWRDDAARAVGRPGHGGRAGRGRGRAGVPRPLVHARRRARGGPVSTADVDLAALADRWRAAWPQALAAWGTTTRMHAPRLHLDPVPDVPSFAWYDSRDVEVH